MSQNRLQILDILKGFTIILVVIGHVIQFGAHNNFDYWNHPVFKIIYTFHMPLFIFISGYLSAYSQKNKPVFEVIFRKFTGLIIPFLMWGFIDFIIHSAGALKRHPADILIILFKYFYFLIKIPGYGLWFLWVLFFIFVLVVPFDRYKIHIRMFAYIVTYILLLIIPFNDISYLFMLKWLYPFFIAGVLISSYHTNLNRNLPIIAVISIIIYCVLILFWHTNDFIYIYQMHGVNTIDGILRLLYRYAVAFSGIAITCVLVKLISAKQYVSDKLSYIGKYTLDIYALQSICVLIIKHLPAIKNTIIFNSVYVPVVTIFILGLCLITSQYILRRNIMLKKLFLGIYK